jgi:HTH-type transcriptional regulator/antitoxin HigA
MAHHTNPIPARMFPPGTTIKSELEARGWTQRKLAYVMGRPVTYVSELLSGKRSITPETALQLEAALEVPARFWINLEGQYRIWKEEREHGEKLQAIRDRRQEALAS